VSARILENVDLRGHNTLALASRARWFCAVDDDEDLRAALDFARSRALPTRVLGGGSNVVLRASIDALVMLVRTRGRELLEDSPARTVLRVAAGEAWHALVLDCHARGWHGLENLALIPGTVGAAPIQNIGAYGVELARFVREVEAVERDTGKPRVFDRERCGFRYRDSVFKHAEAGRLVIRSVTLELPRHAPADATYAALAAELPDPSRATHAEVLAAVIALRRRRLPDPAVLPNAGSFFKNPLLAREAFDALRAREPDVVHWPQPDGSVKLAAAWLIERAGWKGRRAGDAGVHAAQALVLVNHGHASADDILDLAARLADAVRERFGVRLEMEPVVL
jgi:UDP-N-acetylmuramate dehydrogenase